MVEIKVASMDQLGIMSKKLESAKRLGKLMEKAMELEPGTGAYLDSSGTKISGDEMTRKGASFVYMDKGGSEVSIQWVGSRWNNGYFCGFEGGHTDYWVFTGNEWEHAEDLAQQKEDEMVWDETAPATIGEQIEEKLTK